MPIHQHIEGNKVPIKIWADTLESKAEQQLRNIAQLPIIHSHVAAMPDAHMGIGATVGSVLATKEAIIPAAVGVDIGCGMIAARTSLTANDIDDRALKGLYHQICRDVPVGRGQHPSKYARFDAALPFAEQHESILERHPDIRKMAGKNTNWISQIGTLGSGNHFIEICLDEMDRVWVMLHSGSRGIGNAIGNYFIARAKEDMMQLQQQLPDADLAYFPEGTKHFNDYVEAVDWAQRYAMANREEMLTIVLAAMRRHLPEFTVTTEAVNCHHNYVAREHHFGADVWVTRKGAIRAGQGELGIVPGSMGTRSYIVRGLGNADSFESSAHGAGRRMSRGQARKSFTNDDLIAQTQGVICRKDGGVLDEIPGAYKDIDEVMANQSDLTEVLHTLKQIICVKG